MHVNKQLCIGTYYEVFVDGKSTKGYVLEANDEEGWADLLVARDHEWPNPAPSKSVRLWKIVNGKPIIARHTGTVVIKWVGPEDCLDKRTYFGPGPDTAKERYVAEQKTRASVC